MIRVREAREEDVGQIREIFLDYTPLVVRLEGEGLRDIISSRAHTRRAPQIKHHGSWCFAMVLHIACDKLISCALANLPCGACGHTAWINRVKIASCRKYIETPTRRCTSRSRLYKPSLKR